MLLMVLEELLEELEWKQQHRPGIQGLYTVAGSCSWRPAWWYDARMVSTIKDSGKWEYGSNLIRLNVMSDDHSFT